MVIKPIIDSCSEHLKGCNKLCFQSYKKSGISDNLFAVCGEMSDADVTTGTPVSFAIL